MAKFNIEVELDWLGEDGEIDEALKGEITSNIINRISEKTIADINEKTDKVISETVEKTINDRLNEAMEDFLNKPRTITDNYGYVKQEKVSVLDILKNACDNFIEQNVDEEGRTGTYHANMTRIDYIIKKQIDYSLKTSIDKAAAAIKTGLENYVNTTIKNQIGENVAKIIGIDNITKQIGKDG